MITRLGLLLIVSLSLIGLVTAQAPVTLACSDEQISEMARMMETWALQLVESENTFEIVTEMRDTSAQLAAACTGLSFDSDTEGISPAIGPFVVPAGVYRVRIEGEDGAVSVQQTILSGECGYDGQIVGKLSSMESAEAVYTVDEDCEIMLTMGFASKPWALTFEKLR